jgi:hypothetical protein
MQTTTSNAPNMAQSAYVNPSFAAPPVDPNALVQAMSFMATPAGAQTMAAFASHMAGTGNQQGAQPSSPPRTQPPPRYSPTHQSGQKRKWDNRQNDGNTQPQRKTQQQQQGSKPPRAKAAVAPAIPGFGFTLPIPSHPSPSKPNNSRDNKKGKVRFGLTHQEDQPEESSEEEDADEEAALAAKIKGGGYAFEHEGEQISLQTAGDIAEWIKDRRRNFPTHQKAMEKAQAAAEKRKNELEFVRKLKGKPLQPEPRPERSRPAPKVYERSERDIKKQEELAALRKKLHESMMKKKESAPVVDLGLGYTSATGSEAESSVLSDSSVVSSSEESEEESDAESDDSDAPPEATSSKIAPPPVKVPPPPPAQIATERKPAKGKMCNTWKQHGKCPFGDGCRFKHPPKEEEKRLGLYEKLVEQELVKSDQLALDAIKYLGQNGFLG